jgi:hypothetical protein
VCRGRQKNKADTGTDTPYRRRGINRRELYKRRELTDSGNYLFLRFDFILSPECIREVLWLPWIIRQSWEEGEKYISGGA